MWYSILLHSIRRSAGSSMSSTAYVDLCCINLFGYSAPAMSDLFFEKVVSYNITNLSSVHTNDKFLRTRSLVAHL